jgi:hypothetical protein
MPDSGLEPNKQGRVKHVWSLALVVISVAVSLFLLIVDTNTLSVNSQHLSLLGVQYSQSSSQGISSEDQSPVMPVEFAEEEDASVKRLKKLKLALKKSQAEQEKIDQKIKNFRFYRASSV